MEFGRHENSATPFPGAKRIRGFKVGRCRRRARAISITNADVYSCYHSRGRLPRGQWPNSYEFGRRSLEFGHWLCRSGKAFVRTFDGMTAKPHPSPAHSTRSRAERSTVARQRRATLGWVEGREFGHPHNWHLVLYL